MKYLKQFIVGSSYLVTLPYFYAVNYSRSEKNYKYSDYTFVAPLWFGIWNVLFFILSKKFKFSMRRRFLYASITSSISIMIIGTLFKTYNFNRKQWIKYYLGIFIKYLVVWNLIMYNIEKNI